MLLELESFEPVFVEPGESPEDAMARIKPLLVILLDGELETARSDLFFARARRRGVRVVLFKTPGSHTDVRALAEARSIDWISLPVDRAMLARLIGDGTAVTRGRGDRRAEPNVAMSSDGALIYQDRRGDRWVVYDRRGAVRRAADRDDLAGDAEPSYRAFVNERGEEWRVPLPIGEPLAVTAEALEGQLAEAVRFTPESQ